MRRTRLSPSEIASKLADYRDSGMTQQRFCQEQGISLWTFRNWLSRSEAKGDSRGRPRRPLPVIAFTPSSALQSESYRIRFADDTVLHVPATVALETLISALRAKP